MDEEVPEVERPVVPQFFTLNRGDISVIKSKNGAIVNPSNTGLILSRGVSESISRRAGPEFQQKLHTARTALPNNRLELGRAIDTEPGQLHVKRLIHVSIIGKKKVDRKLIANALLNVFDLAEELGLEELAIPPLGIGLGKFPFEEFVELMYQITLEEFPRSECLTRVTLCVSEPEEFEYALKYIKENASKIPDNITFDTSETSAWV